MRIEKQFYWQRIYYRATEKDMGMIPHSIIVFEKRPIRFQTKILSPEQAKIEGYTVKQIVTDYENRLYMNLWIVIINLTWKSNT